MDVIHPKMITICLHQKRVSELPTNHFVIICSLAGYVLYSLISSPECKPINGYDPEDRISYIIDFHGGLPKDTMSYMELGSSDTTYPVKNWEISGHSSVHQTGSKYNYQIDIDVEFEDGDKTTLTYDVTRQGFVLCPFVLGDKPYYPDGFISQK